MEKTDINNWENPLQSKNVLKLQKTLSNNSIDSNFENARKIAILTSGGDSPGMNAAVRSAVRTGIKEGAIMMAVKDGYEGLVNDCIFRLDWEHVSGILHIGGTVLGTARLPTFGDYEVMKKGVYNLVKRGINELVVIGGDGSLTGANVMRKRWGKYVEELMSEGLITEQLAKKCSQLYFVGLIGSIDNDLIGSGSTIGSDTALFRITEAVDFLSSTAYSHQRVFIVEVMGRNCGYLALISALVCGADWLFIPEDPPKMGWEDRLCETIKIGREFNNERKSIIIFAEGAINEFGMPLTSTYVKNVLESRLGVDARSTILGHVQRGGPASAYDRYQGTILGYESIKTLNLKHDPVILALDGYRVTKLNLVEAIENTQKVPKLISQKNFEMARKLRGSVFQNCLDIYNVLYLPLPRLPQIQTGKKTIAVLNAGASSPGMNAAIRAITRLALDKGINVLGVNKGFTGLLKGNISKLQWDSVNGWSPVGGAFIGTSRFVPDNEEQFFAISQTIKKFEIDAIIMVGGFEGYTASYNVTKFQGKFPSLNIPIVCVPATISNNVPCTDSSIGMDKAMSNLMASTDQIKQSALGYAQRVFIVECMGRQCGCQSVFGAIISGAEGCFIPENNLNLSDLQKEIKYLSNRFSHASKIGIYINTEGSSFSTKILSKLFAKELPQHVSVRNSILGNLQQGGNPTPLDRIRSVRMASAALDFILFNDFDFPNNLWTKKPFKSAMIGLHKDDIYYTDLSEFFDLVDMDNRRPKTVWWLDLMQPIITISKESSDLNSSPKL